MAWTWCWTMSMRTTLESGLSVMPPAAAGVLSAKVRKCGLRLMKGPLNWQSVRRASLSVAGEPCGLAGGGESLDGVGGVASAEFDLVLEELPVGEGDGGVGGGLGVGFPAGLEVGGAGHGAPLGEALGAVAGAEDIPGVGGVAGEDLGEGVVESAEEILAVEGSRGAGVGEEDVCLIAIYRYG